MRTNIIILVRRLAVCVLLLRQDRARPEGFLEGHGPAPPPSRGFPGGWGRPYPSDLRYESGVRAGGRAATVPIPAGAEGGAQMRVRTPAVSFGAATRQAASRWVQGRVHLCGRLSSSRVLPMHDDLFCIC